MLEGIMQLGEAVYKKGDISNYLKKVEPMNGKKNKYIIKIDFDLDNKIIKVDALTQMSKDSYKDYNYVGSAKSSGEAQWLLTSTGLNYHLSETIYNILKLDILPSKKEELNEVLKLFFIELPNEKEKYKYLLDITKIDSIGDVNISYDEKDGKSTLAEIVKIFNEYLKREFNITKDQVGLVTICLNGELLANDEEYIKKVIEYKSGATAKKQEKGVCAYCESKNDLVSDLNAEIKFYTTNQVIFASGFNRNNYYKNLQLCSSCRDTYLTGEKYLQNNLSTKFNAFYVYIIPQFIYGVPMNKRDLDDFSKKIKDSFNTVTTIKNIDEARRNIKDSLTITNSNSYFLLNFLFYRSAQASTKVQSYIKDVDPSIFDKINSATIKTIELTEKMLPNSIYVKSVNLGTVYYMTPVKLTNGNPTRYKEVLQNYDAILTSRRLNRRKIIHSIVDCSAIIRLEKDGYNLNPQWDKLEDYIFRANMYIKFLEYLGNIKGGTYLDTSEMIIKDYYKDYIKEMNYNEEQTALFLLGVLVGKIGNKQYKQLGAGNDGRKPILNKINYNGIDQRKLERLANDVFAKLNQLKIRQYNEDIYYEMKKLLDKNINSWGLDKEENLFYLLSGYSFETIQAMNANKNDTKEDVEDEQ
ncbi:TIGR02556 family CRISPR-associated protein [Soehngenia saccharolytica]|nr:TIGR02556 family CRISPR-associated protein [Soehngenia saccharolytica]